MKIVHRIVLPFIYIRKHLHHECNAWNMDSQIIGSNKKWFGDGWDLLFKFACKSQIYILLIWIFSSFPIMDASEFRAKNTPSDEKKPLLSSWSLLLQTIVSMGAFSVHNLVLSSMYSSASNVFKNKRQKGQSEVRFSAHTVPFPCIWGSSCPPHSSLSLSWGKAEE